MLKLGLQQIKNLEDRAREAAVSKFAVLLAAQRPSTLPESDPTRLEEFCRLGFEQANAYNVRAELHVFALTLSMSLLGKNYLDRPEFQWARDILKSPHMPEDVRIGLLRLRILIDTSKDIFDHV